MIKTTKYKIFKTMKSETTRILIDLFKDKISDCEDTIRKLQDDCKHEETKTVDFSPRIAMHTKAEQCIYCDKIVKSEFDII